eukprot:scaffold14104_cov200-Alexandrium_tamarense.AAC.3
MVRYSVGLKKWISYSALYETCQIERIASDDTVLVSEANAKKKIRVACVERAVKVALQLLSFLDARLKDRVTKDESQPVSSSDGGNIHAEDMLVDSFTVEINSDQLTSDDISKIEAVNHQLLNDMSKGTQAETKVTDILSDDHKLLSAVENVSKVDFVSSLKTKPLKLNDVLSPADMCFQSIGLILYQLFSRGKDPPAIIDEVENAHNFKTAEEDEEKAPSTASKSKRRKEESEMENQLLLGHVPTSIRRLVIDLIQSGEGKEHAFTSLDDIAAELKLILVERPSVFFYETNTRGNSSLDFGEEIFGREEEIEQIRQEAEIVSLERDSLLNTIILVGGEPGIGKSSLVEASAKRLAGSGDWLYTSCKFDQMQHRPLSTIASAFEEFFESILDDEDEEDFVEEITDSLRRNLSSPAIVLLCNLVPSLRGLFPDIMRRVVSDTDLSSMLIEEAYANRVDGNGQKYLDDADSSRNRLHHLFRRLIYAISTFGGRGVVFVLDDIHWADTASREYFVSSYCSNWFHTLLTNTNDPLYFLHSQVDLLTSMLTEFDHINPFAENIHRTQRVLFFGLYRTGGVYDRLDTLDRYFTKFDDSNGVEAYYIHLSEMDTAGINTMLSYALKLPMRLTRSLAVAIGAKALGNPFHIRAFLHSLVDCKKLHYSLSEKRWVWDIDEVKATSIGEGVAELLTSNLSSLPDTVKDALRLVSLFGSHVDVPTVGSLKGQGEFFRGLDLAVKKHILEKNGDSYKFPHDMIRQASYALMTEAEARERHLKIGIELSTQLSSSESQPESLVFAAVGQINQAKSLGFTDTTMSVEFATLNLNVGKRSIEVSDYGSALSYCETGIAFLRGGVSGWEREYDLHLRLYESACLASYVMAQPEKTSEFLKEINDNAKCLEDKLSSCVVEVKSLASLGKVEESVERTFTLLSELGEIFPSDVTPAMICEELKSTKTILNGYSKEDILDAPKLTDKRKAMAMKLLSVVSTFLFTTKPLYSPLISCRIVNISVTYGEYHHVASCLLTVISSNSTALSYIRIGFCSESALGLCGYAYSLVSVLQERIEDCCKIGQTALLLIERLGANDMKPKIKASHRHAIRRCVLYSAGLSLSISV